MREFLKLDDIMQKISKLLKKENKAKRIIKAVTISWTVFNVVAVIWSLIPKSDKIDEVDGNELINAVMSGETDNDEDPKRCLDIEKPVTSD